RLGRAVSLSLWGLHKTLEDLDADIIPRPQSSDQALSDWGFLLGLPNGGGGVGRRGGTAAAGRPAHPPRHQRAKHHHGTPATAEDGTTKIALNGSVIIPGSDPDFGTVSAKFVAVTKGTVGNLPAGTTCTWDSPPSGADVTFKLTVGFSGGTDVESNADLYAS